MKFLETKKAIEEMMQKDYKTFVTALISIEKDINNARCIRHDVQKIYEYRWNAIIEWWVWWDDWSSAYLRKTDSK